MGVHVLRTIASWAVVIGKIIALGVLLTAAPGGWGLNSLGRAAVFAEAGRYFILTFYTLVLLFSFLAIIIAPFLTCVYLRIPILVFAIVAFAADQLYFDINGAHLSVSTLQIMWAEREWGGETWTAFVPYALPKTPLIVLVGIILATAPPVRFSLSSKWVIVPASAMVLSSFTIVYTKGATQEFLPPFSLAASVGLALFPPPSQSVAAVPQEVIVAAVPYDVRPWPDLENIVLIVDESVRGDYLGVNGAKFDNTPFLSVNSGSTNQFRCCHLRR